MTCKDCIHYDVCAKKGRRFATHTYGKNYSTTYIENVENACKDFKDKSKIIELPCKVEDRVFLLIDSPMCIREFIIIEFIVTRQGITAMYGHYPWNSGGFFLRNFVFGKTVFLTREEAEKALGEMK